MTRKFKAYWRLMTCRQNRGDTLRILLVMALFASANGIVEFIEEVIK